MAAYLFPTPIILARSIKLTHFFPSPPMGERVGVRGKINFFCAPGKIMLMKILSSAKMLLQEGQETLGQLQRVVFPGRGYPAPGLAVMDIK